jgi:hypothetical protein
MVDAFTPPQAPSAKPVVGGQSHEPVTPAIQRFADQQAAAVAADPWKNPSVVLTRGADGAITARPRTDGGMNGAPDGGDRPATPGDPQQSIKIGDVEVTAEELQGLRERKALEDSRRAQIPQDPSGYQAVLPEDAVLPPGTKVAYNDADPLVQGALKSLREFCHANGLGQREFSQLLASTPTAWRLSKTCFSGPMKIRCGSSAERALRASLPSQPGSKAWPGRKAGRL